MTSWQPEVVIWVTLYSHKDPILWIWSPYDKYKPRYNGLKNWPIKLQHSVDCLKYPIYALYGSHQHCNDIRTPHYEFKVTTTFNSRDITSQIIDQSNRRIYSLHQKTRNICYVPWVTISYIKKFQKSGFNTWFLMNLFRSTNQNAVSGHMMHGIMGHYVINLLLFATNTHAKFGICRSRVTKATDKISKLYLQRFPTISRGCSGMPGIDIAKTWGSNIQSIYEISAV